MPDRQTKEWLEGLGLAEYADAFVRHAVSPELLRDLTDADLLALGVRKLGHRKLLLRGIAALAKPELSDVRRTQDDAVRASLAERRQVSVLFCDLVGSTALSRRLDPEELASIIARFQEIVAEVVHGFGGHVAKFLGDGIMACFGWPVAHEDDAERAVRAGLHMLKTVAAVRDVADNRLSARVGIATGLVVIGAAGSGSDGGIAGETPNIASRLQAEADADMLVVTPITARLAGGNFRYHSLGERLLRGLEEPMELLQVVGPAWGRSRFETQRIHSDAPLVGRDEELELLLSRWRRTRESEGQVVLLSGDAGIGKSRLVNETAQRLGPGATLISYQCSPLHQDIALFPVIQQLQRTAGITDDDSLDAKLIKLEDALLGTGADPKEHLPFLCHLLQVDAKAHKLPDFSPQQLREHLVGSLSGQLRSATRLGPVLVVVEDAQWIDPTTEDFFRRALADLKHRPMMVVVTNRGLFSARWRFPGYTTVLNLERLGGSDSRRLIQVMAGDRLSADVRAKIAARAEGVPLYLEELTLSLIEGGLANNVDQGDDIPVGLQALLANRLDQMNDAKRLVQVGAVLGRQFTAADLRALSGCSDAELQAMLDQSLSSGLLQRHGSDDDAPLVFKHALVHDAAYASLLNSEKKRLHRAALLHLESRTSAAMGGGAASLALHAERGEMWDKAARHLITSCTLAIKASANREAVALFDRTLRALGHLPAEAAAPLAIDVRLYAFSPLLALGEIDRLVKILREADSLARNLGDRRRLAATASQLAGALWLAGDHQAGLRAVEEAERLASELNDFVLRLATRFNHANLLHATGMIRDATQHYAAILDMLPGDLEFKRFGWPGIPSVLARGLLAWSLVWLGDFPRARQTIERALEVVDRVHEPYSTVYAHMAKGLYHVARRELDEAIAAFEAAHRVNRQADMVLPIAQAWLGAAYAQGGRAAEALPLLLEAERSGSYRSGGKYNWIHHYMALAQTYLGLGDVAAAREAIGRAETIARTTGELAHLAWALKLRGDIEAADATATATAAATDAYEKALALAEPRDLRPLVANCWAGLADVHRRSAAAETAAACLAKAEAIYDELGLANWMSAQLPPPTMP